MMKRPTRDDVAREAGVSGWTVSNVLNGRSASITDETRRRVLKAAQTLRYQPNNSARSLVTGQFSTIGFWMCFDYSQHRAHVLHRMQQQMKNSGFEIVIRDVERVLDQDPGFSKTFQLPVDGIITFDTPTAGIVFSRAYPSLSLPLVSMGAYRADGRDFVAVDLYSGAVDAISHLIAGGRRRIVYLLQQVDKNWPREARQDAYEVTMAEAGLETEYLWTQEISLLSSRRVVREYFEAGGKADAIFCHNDDLAMGACRALYDLGMRVGSDVALVGCDGIEETEYLACPLTTIVQPVEKMCATAWEFLQNRIRNPDMPLQQMILKPELAVRASSQS